MLLMIGSPAGCHGQPELPELVYAPQKLTALSQHYMLNQNQHRLHLLHAPTQAAGKHFLQHITVYSCAEVQ